MIYEIILKSQKIKNGNVIVLHTYFITFHVS